MDGSVGAAAHSGRRWRGMMAAVHVVLGGHVERGVAWHVAIATVIELVKCRN